MSHTITITRLPDDQHDDAEFEIGGTCDNQCTVWRECDQVHYVATEAEIDRGEAVWHGVWHRNIFGVGWCVETTECGLDYAYELGLEAASAESTGTYLLDIEWDGDGWVAIIGAEAGDSDG